MKFKEGDIVIFKKTQSWALALVDGDTYIVREIEYCERNGTKYLLSYIDYSSTSAWARPEMLEPARIRDNRLARKLYPNWRPKDGWLYKKIP